MSSSGGKGSNASNQVSFGTFMGALGSGPAFSLEYVIVGGNSLAYTGHVESGGMDFVTVNLIDVGTMRFYFGTETQMPDGILEGYASPQPGYRGVVYVVLINCLIGGPGSSVPTIEIGWRRYPNQAIITNTLGSAQNDGAFTGNPVAITAELLSSWDWLGMSSSLIDSVSAQATADSYQSEILSGDTRPWSAMAPMWDAQTDLKSALADFLSVCDGWIRDGLNGKVEFGRWYRSGAILTNVSALYFDDLTEEADFDVDESDQLPNSFVVQFTDSTLHGKSNCMTCDNTALIRQVGITRRQAVNRPMLNLAAMAKRHGADLLQKAAQPPVPVTLKVRRSRAVRPDGLYIRPGDYITFPVTEPGETDDIRLFRVMKRQFDPVGPVTLDCVMEINTNIQATTTYPGGNVIRPGTPPLYYYRMLTMAPLTDSDMPPVCVLAARPQDLCYEVDVGYSNSSGGDYASIGTAQFATPMSVHSAIVATDTTVTLTLIAKSAGINPQRDASVLTSWSGGSTQANSDQLVLVLVKKLAGNVVLQADGITPWVEFLSVSGPASIVGTDTYSIPVLRGRRSTTPLNFNTGAFPDVWTTYEAWLIPQSDLIPITHPDFMALIALNGEGFFTLATLGQNGEYDPPDAYAEQVRRTGAGLALGEFALQTDNVTFHPAFGFVFATDQMIPVFSQVITYLDLIQVTQFVYESASSLPTTPTGGSYLSPLPTGGGAWTETIPSGTSIWMSKRMFTRTGSGQDPTWSTPVIVTGIDPTVPGTLGQPSLDTEAVYMAGDGTIKAQMTFNLPSSMPTAAQEIRLVYRITGTSNWSTEGQTPVAGGTMTITGLDPGTSYDVGAEAISHDLVYGGVVLAISNPFIAPGKVGGPAALTGGSFTGAHVPPKFDAGTTEFLLGTLISWNKPTDLDTAGVIFKATTTDSDAATDYAWTPSDGGPLAYGFTKGLSGALYNQNPNAGFIRIAQLDTSGGQSAWTRLGNANTAAAIGTGTISSQAQTSPAITGVQLAPIGSSSPQTVNTLAPFTFVWICVGGAPTEIAHVSIAGMGFTAKPTAAPTNVVDPPGTFFADYDFSNASNSSTVMYIKVGTRSGGNISASAAIRISVTPTQ